MKEIVITLLILASAASPWVKAEPKETAAVSAEAGAAVEFSGNSEQVTDTLEPPEEGNPVGDGPLTSRTEYVIGSMGLADSGGPPRAAAPTAPAAPFCGREPLGDDGCWEFSGTFTVTHYCHGPCCNGKRWAYKETASGTWPEEGRTVAVDPAVIPIGSEVLINGRIYIAEDTGVSGYWVDIYCDSHSEALQRGMYSTEVCWR